MSENPHRFISDGARVPIAARLSVHCIPVVALPRRGHRYGPCECSVARGGRRLLSLEAILGRQSAPYHACIMHLLTGIVGASVADGKQT